MAYARYDRQCDWYVFWHEADAEAPVGSSNREEQRLAIWHKEHRAKGSLFSFTQVQAMLQSSDFSAIPGYTSSDRALLTRCLSEFVHDVQSELRRSGGERQ